MVRLQNLLIKAILTLIPALILSGCAQLLLPPLRVLSCSLDDNIPGDGVLIRFSAVPTEASILKAFSMSEDGKGLEGKFSFGGRELRFFPVNGISAGREYVISISTVAEDERGNSLEKEYRRVFFTKTDLEAPNITAIFPADESILSEYPEDIRLFFTEAVDPNSLEKALQISPSISYAIHWEADHREARILPLKPLSWGSRYTVSVSTSLQDPSRNTMIAAFSSTFLLGNDRSAPDISLTRHKTGTVLNKGEINSGLPLDAEFDITFSRDVGIESLAGFVEVRPSLGISVSPERDSRTNASIRFTQRPVWGNTYTLIIRKGIDAVGGGKTEADLLFPLVFDAPEFMPPKFIRGFFRNSGENLVLSNERDFDFLSLNPVDFPTTGTAVPTEICFVFSVSPGTAISAASAMEAFSINTYNNCAYISIKTLRILNEASYRGSNFNDPTLNAGNGKDLSAVIYGIEIENIDRNGLILFSVRSSLKDLLGNSLGEDIKITWNKI
jgi:hypothetical protein